MPPQQLFGCLAPEAKCLANILSILPIKYAIVALMPKARVLLGTDKPPFHCLTGVYRKSKEYLTKNFMLKI